MIALDKVIFQTNNTADSRYLDRLSRTTAYLELKI